MNKIEQYYNKFNEDKRLLSKHGQVEFTITSKFIYDCINNRKNLKILDIGAGTGRYSAMLHQSGHKVIAVEYVKKNLSVLKQNYPYLEAYQGSALNLKKFKDESFDITLVFGPMYHLFTIEDKIKALNEAKRVTKKGGYILVAYLMNEYAVIKHAFIEGNLKECLKNNKLNKDYLCTTNEEDLYSYIRIDEINEINKSSNLTRLKIIGVDGATDYIRPIINQLDEDDFKIFIDYQLSICERYELIGASSHTLDILLKE